MLLCIIKMCFTLQSAQTLQYNFLLFNLEHLFNKMCVNEWLEHMFEWCKYNYRLD